MGDVQKTYNSGGGATDTNVFFKSVNGREPMINEFWCHGIDRLYHKVHHTARIDILSGTIIEFVTEYLSATGGTIGSLENFFNGSVQFIGHSEIRGSGFPYITNPRAPEATRGWGSTFSTNFTGSNDSKGWGRSSINTGSTITLGSGVEVSLIPL